MKAAIVFGRGDMSLLLLIIIFSYGVFFLFLLLLLVVYSPPRVKSCLLTSISHNKDEYYLLSASFCTMECVLKPITS